MNSCLLGRQEKRAFKVGERDCGYKDPEMWPPGGSETAVPNAPECPEGLFWPSLVPRPSLGLYLQGSSHPRRPGQGSDGMRGVKSEV